MELQRVREYKDGTVVYEARKGNQVIEFYHSESGVDVFHSLDGRATTFNARHYRNMQIAERYASKWMI